MSRRNAAPRNTVTVEIAGERHVLRSDVPAEYTRAVAAHLDRAIRNLRQGRLLEPHRAAILAGLSITDELFRTREELERLRQELAERTSALAEILEEALRDPDAEDGGERAEG